jgi:hypothetical protein
LNKSGGKIPLILGQEMNVLFRPAKDYELLDVIDE